MGRLIKADFLKLSKSLGYKVLLLCAFGISIFAGLFMMDIEMGLENGYSAYISSLTDTAFFMIFASIFAGVFVCNEYTNRTFGMSLFSGCSRRNILLSKAIVFIIGFMPIVFIEPVVTCVMLSLTKGFGDLGTETLIGLIRTTLLFIIGCAAIGGFCFMLAVLIKNIGGTIGAGLLIMLGFDLLGMFSRTSDLAKLTFLHQMELLPQLESFGMFILVTVATVVLTLGISVIIFKKTELK